MDLITFFYNYKKIKMGYRLVNNDDFYSDFNNDLYHEGFYVKLKKLLIILTVFCIFAGLGIAIFSVVDMTTSGLIKVVEPLNPVTRSTEEQGSGFLVERDKQTVKLENTGTYDVLSGLGTIVDTFIQNYPSVSVNQTFINENINVSYYFQNISIFLNDSITLTANDKSIILLPNPWDPTTDNANIKANVTYIRSNLNLDTLSANNGVSMTLNPWNPTNGNSIITANQTYINSNLNLSTLNQGNGIIMTKTPWNPSGIASTISVNTSYLKSNLNMSSLNATNGIYITSNPWNPATSGNATIGLDQQGFLAVWTSAAGATSPIGCITGAWSTSATGSWTKGGFNTVTGIYTVPTSGIYEFNLRIRSGAVTGNTFVNVNNVNIMSIIRTGPFANFWLQKVSIPVNAGDVVCINADTQRNYFGASTIPWLSFFGANKVGTL